MTKHYRGPWNAAAVRHRQAPRVYKPCAPVDGRLLHQSMPAATNPVEPKFHMDKIGWATENIERGQRVTLDSITGRVCSASSGLTGQDEGNQSPDSVTMGVCNAPAEAGKNRTNELMFEGRPLRVGDRLKASGSEWLRSYKDTLWTVKAVHRRSILMVPEPGQYPWLKEQHVDMFDQISRVDPP